MLSGSSGSSVFRTQGDHDEYQESDAGSAAGGKRAGGAVCHGARRWPDHQADDGTRGVSAAADNLETRNIAAVDVREDAGAALTLLFDQGHALDERILREQFNV